MPGAPRSGTADLPPVLHGAQPEQLGGSALIPGASLFEIEREAILRTLEQVNGSTARAAEILGVSVRKIQYRLKEYRAGQTGRRRARPMVAFGGEPPPARLRHGTGRSPARGAAPGGAAWPLARAAGVEAAYGPV